METGRINTANQYTMNKRDGKTDSGWSEFDDSGWSESDYTDSGWSESDSLNVDTGENPRRHVVFIKIKPNAYNKYLSQMAGATLIFLGVVFSVHLNFASTCGNTYLRKFTTPG